MPASKLPCTQYHPDKLVGDRASEEEREAATERFQQINQAYHLLVSPESRQDYDILTAGEVRSRYDHRYYSLVGYLPDT